MTLKTINNSSLSQRTLQIQVPGSKHRPTAVNAFLELTAQELDREHKQWMAELSQA